MSTFLISSSSHEKIKRPVPTRSLLAQLTEHRYIQLQKFAFVLVGFFFLNEPSHQSKILCRICEEADLASATEVPSEHSPPRNSHMFPVRDWHNRKKSSFYKVRQAMFMYLYGKHDHSLAQHFSLCLGVAGLHSLCVSGSPRSSEPVCISDQVASALQRRLPDAPPWLAAPPLPVASWLSQQPLRSQSAQISASVAPFLLYPRGTAAWECFPVWASAKGKTFLNKHDPSISCILRFASHTEKIPSWLHPLYPHAHKSPFRCGVIAIWFNSSVFSLSDNPPALDQLQFLFSSGSAMQMDFSPAGYKQRIEKFISIPFPIKCQTGLLRTPMNRIQQRKPTHMNSAYLVFRCRAPAVQLPRRLLWILNFPDWPGQAHWVTPILSFLHRVFDICTVCRA